MKKMIVIALSLSSMLSFSDNLYSLDKEKFQKDHNKYSSEGNDCIENLIVQIKPEKIINSEEAHSLTKDSEAKNQEHKLDVEEEKTSPVVCFNSNELLEIIKDSKYPNIKFYALADLFRLEINKRASKLEDKVVRDLLKVRKEIISFFNFIYNYNMEDINEIIFGIILTVKAIASEKRKKIIKKQFADVIGTLFITGMLISNKFNSDKPYKNIAWAQGVNISLDIINNSELMFLDFIEFLCNITNEEFRKIQDDFIKIAQGYLKLIKE